MRVKHRGFTLIEALIVMIVLASSMTAALYLLSTVVFSTQQNIKRTKAVYLAQECTELARNLRDTAWVNFRNWDCAFDEGSAPFVLSAQYTGVYTLSSCDNMNAAIRIEGVSSNNSDLWEEGSRLTHFPNDPSIAEKSGYTRTLNILSRTDDQINLNCEVNWDFNGKPQSVNALQTLTNWRKE